MNGAGRVQDRGRNAGQRKARRRLAVLVPIVVVMGLAPLALATTVNSCSSSSLASAVASFNSGSSNQTITLKSGCTYFLSSTLEVTNTSNKLTIDGNNSTISGNNLIRVLLV